MLKYFRVRNSLSIRPVYADFIGSSGIFAEIFDMAKDMAATILTCEVSKVRAKTHVRYLVVHVSDQLSKYG